MVGEMVRLLCIPENPRILHLPTKIVKSWAKLSLKFLVHVGELIANIVFNLAKHKVTMVNFHEPD